MNSMGKLSKILGLCATSACLAISSAEAAVNKATVKRVTGSATVSSDKGATWKELLAGSSVKPNSLIKTAAESAVDLSLNENGYAVRILADTTLGIDKLDYDYSLIELVFHTQLDLQKGRVVGFAKKMAGGSTYEVKTAKSVAKIKAGIFEITSEGAGEISADGIKLANDYRLLPSTPKLESPAPISTTDKATTVTGTAAPKATATVANGKVTDLNVTDKGNRLVTTTVDGKSYDADIEVVLTSKDGNGSGARAVAKVKDGVVVGLVVLNQGKGYTQAPEVSFKDIPQLPSVIPTKINPVYTPPPPVAEAASVVANGKVTKVTIVAGGENYLGFGKTADGATVVYNAAPEIILKSADGNGTGARGIAIVKDGVITGILITNPGTGYTSAPIVEIKSKPIDFNAISTDDAVFTAPVAQVAPPPALIESAKPVVAAAVVVTELFIPGTTTVNPEYATVKEITFVPTEAAYITITKEGFVLDAPPTIILSKPDLEYKFPDPSEDLTLQKIGAAARPEIRGATAIAIVENGVIVGIVITDPGFGYSKAPDVKVELPPVLPEVLPEVLIRVETPKAAATVTTVVTDEYYSMVTQLSLPAPAQKLKYEKNKTYDLVLTGPDNKEGSKARATVSTDSEGFLIIENDSIKVTITDRGLGYSKAPRVWFLGEPVVEAITKPADTTGSVIVIVKPKEEVIVEVSTLTRP